MRERTRVMSCIVAAGGALYGCNAILSTSSYGVGTVDAGDDGGADACAVDLSNRQLLEKACTTADCTPFDNGRVFMVDGGQRPVPTSLDAGVDAAPPVDSGGADGGSINPPCSSLTGGGPVVYATGSTALQTFINKVSQVLASTTPPTATVVYQSGGSCAGVHAVLDPVLMVGSAQYFTADGTAHTCDLDPGGTPADIGISDVFAATCFAWTGGLPGGVPKAVQENFGPIQVMNLVVPATSSETSISMEAVRDVFAFGNDSRVAPWTDEAFIFQRNAASGTQNMIAAAIGVNPALWRGKLNAKSGDVQNALVTAGQNPANAPKAIGILASDLADEHRDTLRILALQDKGLPCGYLPDAKTGSKEKQNVRDGHYPIWGPSHFYVSLTNGQPRIPQVRTFITDLSGITPLPGVDLLALYANGHVIPTCAMHVTRDSDGADYRPYRPKISCSCYYDQQVGNTQSTCKACNANSDCPGQQCNKFGAQQQGFCEAIGTDD